ncbi:hypothetical protein CWR48_00415 [Oceanobacillus arenosus]|uniref:Autolysin n=1 Tax=Oceanobacillus arenosus TaxID=1229153 RepID=A0A3D8Q1P6_9BACI|nr:cell wall-binding repeat-containing protein [Oceanobacillus arenosus]RDW22204.1 hypothetical protein CWR48_00415 [Oceanobacillus arenosus]
MKKISLAVALALIMQIIFLQSPAAAESTEHNEQSEVENTKEALEDEYNEFGIKIGTEVYGIDISKFSEEELQYVPEAWRDGVFDDSHPEAEEEPAATLNASYPDVNNYIKNMKPVNIDYNHINHLPKFPYRSGYGAVEGVVAHETANDKSTINGEINYMKGNYKRAFVHAFIDHNHIIETHPTDYGAWGAGPIANDRFVHVELVRVHSFDQFARSINNYAYYIAKVLFDYNLGVTDAENTGKGTLWSHKAVSTHLGGTNHVDPHGYFARYGYKWNDFVNLVTSKYNEMSVQRISGHSRYDTAVAISQDGWKTANSVVVARGDDYADALAGVTLAKKYNSPLLLTQSNQFTDVTKKEIQRLKATNIYILGGELAVSKSVENEMRKLVPKVKRIGGGSRIDTAVAIAKEVNSGVRKAVIVDGYDFPDALSVASYASQQGMPILLTQNNKLPEQTKQALKDLKITNTLAIGGNLAISDNVFKQLPNPVRISGQDRYETAVKIAEYFNLKNKHYYITTGLEFPDALSSAALAAKEGKGLLLVGKIIPKPVDTFITKNKISDFTIVGGTTVIPTILQQTLSRY